MLFREEGIRLDLAGDTLPHTFMRQRSVNTGGATHHLLSGIPESQNHFTQMGAELIDGLAMMNADSTAQAQYVGEPPNH
jgi:hypothetical protein